LAHVAAETLNLPGASIDILGEHWLGALLAEMLTRLAERLRHSRHRLGEVLLTEVEPRRDLLGGLIRHRANLRARLAALRAVGILAHTGDAAHGVLHLVDYLATQVLGLVSHRRCGIVVLAS